MGLHDGDSVFCEFISIFQIYCQALQQYTTPHSRDTIDIVNGVVIWNILQPVIHVEELHETDLKSGHLLLIRNCEI